MSVSRGSRPSSLSAIRDGIISCDRCARLRTYCREVGRIKKQSGLPVNDKTRVEDVLRRIAAANRGPLRNEHLRKIYETIVREMTAFEAADMARR